MCSGINKLIEPNPVASAYTLIRFILQELILISEWCPRVKNAFKQCAIEYGRLEIIANRWCCILQCYFE